MNQRVRQAIVFANGECRPETLARCPREDDCLLVCVDGGLRHCLSISLQPDIILGDFDSVDPAQLDEAREQGVQLLQHPTEKDATDLELALEYLCQQEVTDVILLGVVGGRIDHMLANVFVMANRQWPFSLRFLDTDGDGYLVQAAYPFNRETAVDCTISLLPLGAEVSGVTTTGLYYPLQDATLRPASTMGVSNVSVAREVCVNIAAGSLLVMVNLAS